MIKSPQKRKHSSKRAVMRARSREEPEPAQLPEPQSQNRSVGSLVLLTQKFVHLMKENGGQIDLSKATTILNVQKRRIYDITNVLEGVGLIEKTRHSSIVRWRGDVNNIDDDTLRHAVVARSNHLSALEADLDIQLDYARRNLKFIREDGLNKSYAYVTRDDLLSIYGEDVVFTIPCHDEEVQFNKTDKKLHVSLDNGSTIDVRLVTDQGKCMTTTVSCESTAASTSNVTRTDTPSPSHSSHSIGSIETEAEIKSNLVTDEHKYFCNPELKEQMDEIEKELIARVVFQNCTAGHSLRRFYPDNPNLENPPLVPVNPPQNEYNFVLSQDEGVCEVFDIPCS